MKLIRSLISANLFYFFNYFIELKENKMIERKYIAYEDS